MVYFIQEFYQSFAKPLLELNGGFAKRRLTFGVQSAQRHPKNFCGYDLHPQEAFDSVNTITARGLRFSEHKIASRERFWKLARRAGQPVLAENIMWCPWYVQQHLRASLCGDCDL